VADIERAKAAGEFLANVDAELLVDAVFAPIPLSACGPNGFPVGAPKSERNEIHPTKSSGFFPGGSWQCREPERRSGAGPS
jgi:hypothetical protein